MKSLFWKIFIWFWLASVLIIISTLLLISVIEPYYPVPEDAPRIKRMAKAGRSAVALLERDGPGALKEFTSRRGRKQGRHLFLFDDHSRLLTGGTASADVKELAAAAGQSGATEFKRIKDRVLMAHTIFGRAGDLYIMVAELRNRPHHSPFNRFLNPRFLSLRLLAIFIVASVFCYWLARYLTAPAKKLKTATSMLASGNLSTRVTPELGRRRDELADLGRDFDVMAERIESLINSQNRLLRDISHELRSPLARLNVALELARQRAGEAAAPSLDRIALESERLNHMIGELRTLTLMESGAESIDIQPVDLTSLVNVIADDAEFETGKSGMSIKRAVEEGVTVTGNRELLHRTVENVLRNALRYTAEGTAIELSLNTRQNDVNRLALLIVRDYGPGVPEGSLHDLFKPFYRVAESRDRRTGGMGIGLAIADSAVKLHGGTVKALNAPGGGLLIEIELPLDRDESIANVKLDV